MSNSSEPTPLAEMVRSAELLAVGTELLLGEIVDTNSAYLAQQLADRSVDVYWSQRVGDNRQRIREAIEAAAWRSDLVLICGGLGPTDDDLTREAIADLMAEVPRIDAQLEADLRRRFAAFSRSMPERNLKQAWLIPSATALPNPVGTAPGWLVRPPVGRFGAGRSVVIAALPGPPSELKPMWHEQLRPQLTFPTAKFIATTLKTFGIGESQLAERLGDLTLNANPSVATYAKRDGVAVRIAAKGSDEDDARARLGPTLAAVSAALEGSIWGGNGDEMSAVVLRMLRERGGRLSFVDFASGGALASQLHEAHLAAVDGSDPEAGGEPLVAGMVGWGHDALDVLDARATAALFSSSSTPVEQHQQAAEALARAARARFETDHSVALTPWRRVATNGVVRPSWAACLAVLGPNGAYSRCVTLPPQGAGARDERLAFTALFSLWSLMKHGPVAAP